MKKIGLALLVAVCSFKVHAQEVKWPVIRKVSALDLKALIDSSKGPMIVNFWATWCSPCLHEIQWFDSIITEKNAPVKLVLVSLDFKFDYPHKLASFVKKHGYKGEVVYLDDTNMRSYIQTIEPRWKGAIPASIFVNHQINYYEVFNEQVTARKFALELQKLTGALPAVE